MSVGSRRSFLVFGLKVSAVGAAAVALNACGGKPAASAGCIESAGLTASEQSLRESMKYTDEAPDPAATCAGCEFFTTGEGGGPCGTCEIFTGGPASAGGHCEAWAAKPA